MTRIKDEIRVVGFDDSPFDKNKDKSVVVVGVIFRGNKYMDGMLKTKVRVDGFNATKKLIGVINSSRHKPQLKAIMTNGITFGGFNIVDINTLSEKTGLPVIAIVRKKPNFKKIKKALKNLSKPEYRWELIKKAGKPIMLELPKGKLYYQYAGTNKKEAEEIIKKTIKVGNLPEPLRLAHIIATAIVRGESYGRA